MHLVEAFLKSKGYAAEEATREEVLEAFNELVRHHVFQAMRSSSGLTVAPYVRVAIAACLTKFAHNLDEAAGIANKIGMLDHIKVLTYLLHHFITCVAHVPLSILLLGWLLRKFTRLSGCANWVWTGAVAWCLSACLPACLPVCPSVPLG